MKKTLEITPDEILDYSFMWADELGADSIQTSTITVGAGLTVDSISNNADSATVFVSGGVLKRQVYITNKIVTVGGRTQARSILVKVVPYKLS